eukprot:gb/GECH01001849.1/.p1 GENE.gb/GECH01001849.1/~~gb/GECH01001849.1/.p1  ORF type:complete len:711 (+),score=175.60 gb/GECH01001849.1/:1-2133(+)
MSGGNFFLSLDSAATEEESPPHRPASPLDDQGTALNMKDSSDKESYFSNKIKKVVSNEETELNLTGDELHLVTNSDLQNVSTMHWLKYLDISSNGIKELPDCLGNLSNLQVLIINKNELKSLPGSIDNLKQLEELQVRLNQLRAWPPSVNRLERLKKLDLAFNELEDVQYGLATRLSQFLGSGNIPLLTSLRHLNISFNNLTGFPTRLYEFRRLEHLDISANAIDKIPKSVEVFEEMKRFKAVDCGFKSFPEHITRMHTLEELDLSDNKVKEIPLNIHSLPHLFSLKMTSCNLQATSHLMYLSKLTYLNLHENRIKTFPEHLDLLRCLKEIVLSKNLITEIPEDIGELEQLEILDVSRNRIKTVPHQIGELRSLKTLNMEHNAIQNLPSSISNLTSLTELNLGHNKLQELPRVSNMTHLQKLFAPNNQIPSFPDGFDSLELLESLNLQRNHIETIPDCFYHLTKLKDVNLKENHIAQISNDISNLHQLQRLILENNELQSIPVSITQLSCLAQLGLSFNDECFSELPEEIEQWQEKNNVNITVEFEKPDKVLDGLYIGSADAVSSKHSLQSMGITHILTLAKDIPPFHPKSFEYKIIPVEDARNAKVYDYFDECFDFINQGRKNGGVVVHCQAGVSRSATIVTAYLMKEKRLGLRKAFNLLRAARPKVYPNEGFRQQLRTLDQELEEEREGGPNIDESEPESSSNNNNNN